MTEIKFRGTEVESHRVALREALVNEASDAFPRRSLRFMAARYGVAVTLAILFLASIFIFIDSGNTTRVDGPPPTLGPYTDSRPDGTKYVYGVTTGPMDPESAEAQSWQEYLSARERYNTLKAAQEALDDRQKNLPFPKISILDRTPGQATAGYSTLLPAEIYVLNKSHVDYMKKVPELADAGDLVTIIYANGLRLTYNFKVDGSYSSDYSKRVEGNVNSRDDGTHTGLLNLVSINGFPGCGQEPGEDYFPVIDHRNVRGALLDWTDDIARYTLRAPRSDRTTTLSDLKNVAESMYR